MHANQLRLWLASMAYVLLTALRRIGLAHTELAKATCGTIRLRLLKIGAVVTRSVRRIRVAMSSACPDAAEFRLAHADYPAESAPSAATVLPSNNVEPAPTKTSANGATAQHERGANDRDQQSTIAKLPTNWNAGTRLG